MTENVENLILELLRSMRADLSNLNKKMVELTLRFQAVEGGIASIKSDIAHHYGEIALVNARYDNVIERIDRMERRLEISNG